MKTLLKWWQEYSTNVLPETASSVQIMETRRAFYAGAQVMFQSMLDASEKGELDGTKVLDGYARELTEFAHKIGKGF